MPIETYTRAFRVRYQYSLGDVAWQEVIYWFATNVATDLATADFKQYGVLRRAFLGKNVQNMGFSYTGLIIKGGSDIALSTMGDVPKGHFGGWDYGGMGGVNQKDSVKVIAATAMMASADGTYRRNMALRGLPYDLWSYDSSSPLAATIPGSLSDLLDPWENWVMGLPVQGSAPKGRFAILASEQDVNANPIFRVDDVTTTGTDAGNWILKLHSVPGWQVNQKIHVHNVKGEGLKGINGESHILDIQGQNVTLFKVKPDTCPIDYLGNGEARLRMPRLHSIGIVEVERYRIRNTGGTDQAGKGKKPVNPNLQPS